MIDDEAHARRLARAICADILLYNDAKARAATKGSLDAVLAAELAEGRELFASRVAPAWLPLFDEAYAAIFASVRRDLPDGPAFPVTPAFGTGEPPLRAHPPVDSFPPDEPYGARRARGSSSLPLVLAVIALAIALAAAALALHR